MRTTYAAEEEASMHSHPDRVLVFLSDGSFAAVLEDGTENEISGTAGEAAWASAVTHRGKALTDMRRRGWLAASFHLSFFRDAV